MKGFIGIGLLMIVFALLLAACSSPAPTSTPTATATTNTDAMGDTIPEVCQQAKARGGTPVPASILWSIYVGWMPYGYGDAENIFEEWGEKCNVRLSVRMGTDYISTVEAFVAGQTDGVTMTNMEALNFAAASGVDTTAVIVGDYSDGNDAVITRNDLGICDLAGTRVFLVELSVSHYLLARGLQEQCSGLDEADLQLTNTSDADIGTAFLADPSQQAIVTWNPIKLVVLAQDANAKNVFDSSKTPGEIDDILFVRTNLLQSNPEVGAALAGAWYEIMGIMNSPGSERDRALRFMAEAAGDAPDSFRQQLQTTHMFWTPESAVQFTEDPALIATMDLVRRFSFDHDLLGQGAGTVDDVGIEFPDGTILGDPSNVKLRFTSKYMEMIR